MSARSEKLRLRLPEAQPHLNPGPPLPVGADIEECKRIFEQRCEDDVIIRSIWSRRDRDQARKDKQAEDDRLERSYLQAQLKDARKILYEAKHGVMRIEASIALIVRRQHAHRFVLPANYHKMVSRRKAAIWRAIVERLWLSARMKFRREVRQKASPKEIDPYLLPLLPRQEPRRGNATDIPCPVCGTGVGEMCRMPGGRRSPRVHVERESAFNQQQTERTNEETNHETRPGIGGIFPDDPHPHQEQS